MESSHRVPPLSTYRYSVSTSSPRPVSKWRQRLSSRPRSSTSRALRPQRTFTESADGEAAQAYVNVLAVKEGRETEPAIQALAAALCSDEVKTYIEENYNGAVVAVF